MRTSKACLDFKVEQINKRLNRSTESWKRIADKNVAAIGNFHIDCNAPGDGYRRYQLHEMMNEHGGINVVGNRTLLGGSNFEDYLTGILEGIRLQRESQKETINYALQYISKGIADGAFNGCVIDPEFLIKRLEELKEQ